MEKNKTTDSKGQYVRSDEYRRQLHTLAVLDLQDVPCTKYVLPEGNDLVVCERCTCDRDTEAESRSDSGEFWIRALTDSPDILSEAPPFNSSPVDDSVPREEDYDAERTFGASKAPWVGAEDVWREGRVPPPAAARPRYSEQSPMTASAPRRDKDNFTTDELAAVISTTPPRRTEDASPNGRLLALLRTAVVAALGGVVIWTIYTFNSSSKGKADRSTVSAANQAAFTAPPGASPAGDGVRQRESISETSVARATGESIPEPEAVEGKQPEATVVEPTPYVGIKAPEGGEDEVQAKPLIATTIALAQVPRSIRENTAAKMTFSEDEALAAESIPEPATVEEGTPSGEEESAEADSSREDTVEEDESASSPVIAPAPRSTEEKVLSKPADENPMAAILMGAKTTTPEARARKDRLAVLLGGRPTSHAEAAPAPHSPAVVRQTLSSLAPQVKRCGTGKPGRIVMDIVVSGSTGRVLDATPKSKEYQGTPTGICASRAMKLAKFPKSELVRQHVEHTFDLQ